MSSKKLALKLFWFASGAAVLFIGAKVTKILIQVQKLPKKEAWPIVKGWPIIGSVEFYFGKAPFLKSIAHLGPLVEFRILHLRIFYLQDIKEISVLANSLESAISFNHATSLFVGGNILPVDELVATPPFMKSISQYLATPSLFQDKLDIMVQDISEKINELGQAGTFDPFDYLYQVAFLLSTRVIAAEEFCEPKANQKLRQLIDSFDYNSSGVTTLFPYFPTIWKAKATWSTAQLVSSYQTTINKRRKSDLVHNDYLDFVMKKQSDIPENLFFLLLFITLWVAVVNTGFTTSWAVLFLIENPEWKEKVLDHLTVAVANDIYGGDIEMVADLHNDLKKMSLKGWESLELLDWVVQETVRMTQAGVLARRVVKQGQTFHGHKLPLGSFVVYSMHQLHNDPVVFAEPEKFNPGRWSEERLKNEDKYYFAGFGSGRHPCVGHKLARLELKLIIGLVVSKWDMRAFVKGSDDKVNLLVDSAALTTPSPKQQGISISFKSKK
jgi:sterol 14-demethylase